MDIVDISLWYSWGLKTNLTNSGAPTNYAPAAAETLQAFRQLVAVHLVVILEFVEDLEAPGRTGRSAGRGRSTKPPWFPYQPIETH